MGSLLIVGAVCALLGALLGFGLKSLMESQGVATELSQQSHPSSIFRTDAEGFKIGEIVRHKLDPAHRVVISYFIDCRDQGLHAWCVYSASPGDESQYALAELEHIPQATA